MHIFIFWWFVIYCIVFGQLCFKFTRSQTKTTLEPSYCFDWLHLWSGPHCSWYHRQLRTGPVIGCVLHFLVSEPYFTSDWDRIWSVPSDVSHVHKVEKKRNFVQYDIKAMRCFCNIRSHWIPRPAFLVLESQFEPSCWIQSHKSER